jgi:lipoate-protein ligase A
MRPMVEEATFANRWRLLDLSLPSVQRNLAIEEALLADSESGEFQPTIRLWVDPPAAVLGRFQQAEAELDLEQCRKNGVQIARRFTGGGAVYHDEGNLNLTMVTSRPVGISLMELHKNRASILTSLLHRLGLETYYVPPNSITISGKKIAGAAAALNRSHTLWHTSILVSTDTRMLNRVLRPSTQERNTHFIRSNWMPVTTLQAVLGKPVKLEQVKTVLIGIVAEKTGADVLAGALSTEEERLAGELYENKYSSERWNLFGIVEDQRDKRGGERITQL